LSGAGPATALAVVEREIIGCRRCPRLVEWRERVAREKRAAYADWDYWGRPLPGFGDPRARLLILGLAPAAHGANRTGRFFTGDRSGEFLFAALHRTGYANRPASDRADDGFALSGAFITAAVRCAPPQNRPLPSERANCAAWLHKEIALLSEVRVVLCLGAIAWGAGLRLREALGDPAPRPQPRFGHGAELPGARLTLLGAYHPSQQNTFTRRLVPEMLDDALRRGRELSGAP
jgi:uracil-DNA glycosylase family 4